MTLRARTLLLLLALGLGAGACKHKVHVISDPEGATVRIGRQNLGPTPRDVSFFWWPFRPMTIHVQAPGYRPVDLSLHHDVGPVRFLGELVTFRWKRLFGVVPRADVEVLLVREHDGVGTWSPDDVSSRR